MNEHIFSVEYNSTKRELDITIDADGLEDILLTLQNLQKKFDHEHFFTPQAGGEELSETKFFKLSTLIHHLKIIRPKDKISGKDIFTDNKIHALITTKNKEVLLYAGEKGCKKLQQKLEKLSNFGIFVLAGSSYGGDDLIEDDGSTDVELSITKIRWHYYK